jgi:hypothetical protein
MSIQFTSRQSAPSTNVCDIVPSARDWALQVTALYADGAAPPLSQISTSQ